MAYSTSAPPVLVSGGGIGGTAPRTWTYTSTDAATVVDASGYLTNAGDLGIKVNDIILVTDSDASPVVMTTHRVVTVSSTAPGAADLSDLGATIGSTNSD